MQCSHSDGFIRAFFEASLAISFMNVCYVFYVQYLYYAYIQYSMYISYMYAQCV